MLEATAWAVKLEKCPRGGFHNYQDRWDYVKYPVYGYEFAGRICAKCGESWEHKEAEKRWNKGNN